MIRAGMRNFRVPHSVGLIACEFDALNRVRGKSGVKFRTSFTANGCQCPSIWGCLTVLGRLKACQMESSEDNVAGRGFSVVGQAFLPAAAFQAAFFAHAGD